MTIKEQFLLEGTPSTLGLEWRKNHRADPAGVVPVTTVKSGEESDRPGSLDVVERAAHVTERGSAGLPVGVQVAARLWREDLVLAAMSAIEHAVRARFALPLLKSMPDGASYTP